MLNVIFTRYLLPVIFLFTTLDQLMAVNFKVQFCYYNKTNKYHLTLFINSC